ncbi:MAG: anaerobic ribonucleoside-triphosphate reductase activating protein [Clostridia bacterium]|nr:anaerobic ribonucleoside-triphosphate reductase activating protein [Clostridia bacterium]
MRIRISGIVEESIVDGPGFRMAVFVQGCPHHCPGCHNPQTHDFDAGTAMETGDIVRLAVENPLLDGVTLTGGEPFCQSEACARIAKAVHEAGLNVWSYSGWTYEELLEKPECRCLLEAVDVLVDGPFQREHRTLELRFRGSSNQRLIDVRRSLLEGRTVEVVLT